MALHWFHPPVYVKTDRPGLRYGVSHVEGAAEELMAWDTKGPRWTKAVQSCVDAFEGRVSSQEVREAFEAAAKEASVYLLPE
ncbi:DUF982 domain-containing protein [Mesorhizobium sp. L48C026A00]|uniref:DUF982 domain-containing protein n=1 Tax=Mesorhizobium sp. L48C026A00 TaxID=1287182 RepID=UPI0003D068DB|nr:DUF982 domain-containing protein [Mesorhizobium sp. L48C026A00]ESZ01166.1 hypothetical protein X737_38845 [Mesorhizobium sp. L48C026A00]